MKYYMIQFDWEFMTDSEGGYDTRITRAARLRETELPRLRMWLEELNLHPTLVPTTYKPKGTQFIDVDAWGRFIKRCRSW